MTTRNKKTEHFLIARSALYLVGLAAAAFGVAGWILPELPLELTNLPWAALVLASLTALSALVVPATIEIVGKSRASALLLAPAIVFGALNAYSFHNAVGALIEAPRQAEHMAAADQRLATAQGKLDAFPAMVMPVCPRACPNTIRATTEAWEKQRAPLAAALETAKADHTAAEAAYKPLAPDLIVWIVAGLVDLSLALGLAGIALVRSDLEAKRKAERLALRKAAQKAAAKPKAPKKLKPADVLSAAELKLMAETRGARLTVVR